MYLIVIVDAYQYIQRKMYLICLGANRKQCIAVQTDNDHMVSEADGKSSRETCM